MERDTRTRASQPCLAAPPQADAETAGRHKVISALVKSANRKRASQPCLVAPSQADAETAGRHKVSSANRRPSFHIWHLPIGGEVWLRSLRLPIRLSYLSKLTNLMSRVPTYFPPIWSTTTMRAPYQGAWNFVEGKLREKEDLISRSLESGSSAKGKSVKKELTS